MKEIKLELMDWKAVEDQAKDSIRKALLNLEMGNHALAKAREEIKKLEKK